MKRAAVRPNNQDHTLHSTSHLKKLCIVFFSDTPPDQTPLGPILVSDILKQTRDPLQYNYYNYRVGTRVWSWLQVGHVQLTFIVSGSISHNNLSKHYHLNVKPPYSNGRTEGLVKMFIFSFELPSVINLC